ncbi:hypothetical protein CDD81_5852 [Ophiocordyceps australis]|uniref:Uncharacterized protein n=1 Tax=Ophiocordyceps australis TaxID=1399860 RepID=A0A2C5YGV8_9HYPO|nr:hypothetical protein CDD81_5852 [Ophiocordyceps australis]
MVTVIPFRVNDDSVMISQLSDGRLIAESLVKPDVPGNTKQQPVTIAIKTGEGESETITTHKFVGSLRPVQVFFARARHLNQLFRPVVWVSNEEKQRRKMQAEQQRLRNKQLYKEGKAAWKLLSREEQGQFLKSMNDVPGSTDEKLRPVNMTKEDKRRREWQKWTGSVQNWLQNLKDEMRREQHVWKQELNEEMLKMLEAAVEDHEGVAADWKGMVDKDWERMMEDVNKMLDCEGQKWSQRIDDRFDELEEAWKWEWDRRFDGLDDDWNHMFEARFQARAEEWRQRLEECFKYQEKEWARKFEEFKSQEKKQS